MRGVDDLFDLSDEATTGSRLISLGFFQDASLSTYAFYFGHASADKIETPDIMGLPGVVQSSTAPLYLTYAPEHVPHP